MILPVVLEDRLLGRPDALLVEHITGHADGLSSALPDFGGHLFGSLRTAADDGDLGSRLGQRPAELTAQSAASACDHRNLSAEVCVNHIVPP